MATISSYFGPGSCRRPDPERVILDPTYLNPRPNDHDGILIEPDEFERNGKQGPFGVGTSGSVTEKQVAFFENIFFEADPIALERCLQIYTREDLTEGIKRFGQIFHKPFLLIHGGGDGGVPAEVSAELVQKSVPGAKLTIYDEGGHVLVLAYADRLLDDIVNFAGNIEGRN